MSRSSPSSYISRTLPRVRRGRSITAFTALTLATAAAWIVWIEPRRLVLRRRTLTPARWPRELDGLTVACVSDLHAGAPHVGADRVAAVVRSVNALSPDLVALLGDFVDPHVGLGRRVEPERVAAALAGLEAPAFAVLGNHDHIFGARRVATALSAAGLPVLVNRIERLPNGLHVAGLDDATCGRPDLAMLADASRPLLVLSHDPDLFPRIPATACLTLSGHTHGGQINLPVVRARAIPSRFGDRYDRGLREQGGKLLYVTSGIGTSRWPVRLLRPPEIVLLTLRARGGGAELRPEPARTGSR